MSFFAPEKTADDIAVFEGDEAGAEGAIHVAVRVQNVLAEPIEAALPDSIELRRAPWILWIKDLSQYDPYYVIPILMAVAMFVQQKMTPTANVDPAQAKMMMVMPLLFIFMFLSTSSGLALYWLTSNVIGVGQQVFINKYWSPRAEAKLQAETKRKQTREK